MTRSTVHQSATPAPALEIVELELALQHQDFVEKGFEGSVRQALERIGGTLLFRTRMGGVAGCDWLAAVSLDAAGERKLAIVAQPSDGGALRVEDAETSEMPAAPLAKAYADLMGKLGGQSQNL